MEHDGGTSDGRDERAEAAGTGDRGAVPGGTQGPRLVRADVAMVNETLAKVLCHNLVVLIHEMYELGLDPSFWAGATDALEIPA